MSISHYDWGEYLIATARYYKRIESHSKLVDIGKQILLIYGVSYSEQKTDYSVTANGKRYLVDIYGETLEKKIVFEAGSIIRPEKVFDLCQTFDIVLHLPYYDDLKLFTKQNAPKNYVTNNSDLLIPVYTPILYRGRLPVG